MTVDKPIYTVEITAWDSPAREEMVAIRFAVFVDEQQVPAAEELDDFDAHAVHVIARDTDGLPAGTGRLYAEEDAPRRAHIGRMAVLTQHRGNGCGAAILSALVDEARNRGFEKIVLNAQTHAAPFYAKFGFAPIGKIYPICGIPHQDMQLRLNQTRQSET